MSSMALIIVVTLIYFWAAVVTAFEGQFAQTLILIGYMIANVGLALSLR